MLSQVGASSRASRFVYLFIALALSGALFTPSHAAAALDATTSFSPLDSARDAMDIGGVADGTTDRSDDGTGDELTIQLTNAAGATTAFDLTLTATLPANFRYLPGTARDDRGWNVSASQSGATLTFNLGGNDLAPGNSVSIRYQLVADVGTPAGTRNVTYHAGWGDAPGSSGNTEDFVQLVTVKAGATTITKTPSNQLAAVGDTVSWIVTVTNTGLGGLFDVVVDESAINPGGSLQLLSITQLEPVSPPASGNNATRILDYLASGKAFKLQVTARVIDCENIINQVTTSDRTTATAKSTTAQITLDLERPMVEFTAPDIDLAYDGTTRVTLSVTNSPETTGTAFGVRLRTTLADYPVQIVPVGNDWTYSAGFFFLQRNAGQLVDNETIPLVFDVIPTGTRCAPFPGGLVVWTAIYANSCDDDFKTPTDLGSLSGWLNEPTLALDKTSSTDRLEVGESGSWTIRADGSNTGSIQGSNLVVTDPLPADITSITISAPPGTTYDCGGDLTCTAGETLTWTIPLTTLDANGPLDLRIDFTAPGGQCFGGTSLTNAASASATTTQSCTLNRSDSAVIYLGNNPETAVQQTFNTQGGTVFETGRADDGDATREDNVAGGEGQFIPFVARFVFGPASPGTWAGSNYLDDFGALPTQRYVAGTLTYRLGGGPATPVPNGSIDTSGGRLRVDLAFLSSVDLDGAVAGETLQLDYRTTVSDADLGGQAARGVVQKGTLTVAGSNEGCPGGSDGLFSQFVLYTVERADVAADLSFPTEVSVCESFPVTITVRNTNSQKASHLLIDLLTANSTYEVDTSVAPVYGGQFAVTPPAYTAPSGPTENARWILDPPSQELTITGTITVQLRKRPGTGDAALPLSARVEYDDNETAPTTLTREFNTTGTNRPALVRLGDLRIRTSPQTYQVTSRQARWVIYVQNAGNGVAREIVVRDLPSSALTMNLADTNAANAVPATLVSGALVWNIPTLAAGATVELTVIADVNGSTCTPADGNQITAQWGCGGVIQQQLSSTDPVLLFPAGQLQTFHDTTQTAANLCDAGRSVIVVRNTGLPHVYDLTVTEDLQTATSGLSLVPGSLEYSTDGGASYAPALADPPQIAGVYQITSAQVPVLADLAPLGESGGVATVYLRYQLASTNATNGYSGTINAATHGTIACGQPASSPGDFATPRLNRPDIFVFKTGRNLTAGDTAFSESVFGAAGDTVQWRLEIRNNGRYKAKNVRLVDDFPATGTTSGTLTHPGGATSTLNSGIPMAIAEVGAGQSVVYQLDQTLGGTCTADQNQFDVTWGCIDSTPSTQRSALSAPTDNTDTADLQMNPDFSAASAVQQQFTARPGGRTSVTLTLRNDGASTSRLVITDSLPSGQAFDGSVAPVFGGSATIGSTSVDSSNLQRPIFTITGTIAHNQTVTVQFAVLPTTGFDTTATLANTAEVAPAEDPVLPASGANQLAITARNSCGTDLPFADSDNFDPQTPDVDITATASKLIVKSGDVVTVSFTLINNGDTGSIADALRFSPTIGTAWTNVQVVVTNQGTGGSAGICNSPPSGFDCTEAQLGQLYFGQTATITFTGTAVDNEAANALLTLIGNVEGSLLNAAGTDTGNNYSLDAAQIQITGFALTKTLKSSSETITNDPVLTIGEEATWTIHARWFGTAPLTNVSLRDSLPAGLGYVSYTTVAPTNTVTVTLGSAPTPVTSGVINWTISDLASGFGTLELDLVTRVLNNGATQDSTTLVNNVGAKFDAVGRTFASNNAADNLGGDQADLHAEGSLTVRRPAISVDKQVRNVTNGASGFSQSTSAIAGDLVEYRVQITNTGGAPAMDLSLADALTSVKLIMQDGASDGVDNDGDGTIDDLTEGSYNAVAGGSVFFDDANTAIPAASPARNLARLDVGQTLTLLYRALVDSAANPQEVLGNGASVSGSSLPGNSGSQTNPTGDPGDPDGELSFGASDTSNVTVQAVTLGKSLSRSAVGGDTSTDVVIGEQLEYTLQVLLPAGTVPNFIVTDVIPSGLALLRTPAVDLASVPGGQPSITPTAPPAVTSGPTTVTWNFGTRVVPPGTEAARTVTIRYLVQVENVAANQDGTALANDASFSVGGVNSAMNTVTVTLREPRLALTKRARNITRGESAFVNSAAAPDAGDLLEYQIVLRNSGSATAYDLNFVDSLETGLQYIAGTTAGGITVDPDVTGTGAPGGPQTLTWGRTQSSPLDIDLAPAGTLTFTFRVQVRAEVEPSQSLDNTLRADGTSLDGDPGPNLGTDPIGSSGGLLGERTGADGSSGLNDLSATATSPTDSPDPLTLSKTASGATLGGNDYRVGDLVRYTLTVGNLFEGTIDQFVVRDTLPANMQFVRTISIDGDANGSPWSAAAPLSYADLIDGANAPAPGSSGTLSWNFGTLGNSGDNTSGNDQLVIVYEARVKNSIPDAPTTTLTNAATLDHQLASGGATSTRNAATAIDALQPQLAISKAVVQAPNPVVAGATIKYRVTVTNNGSAPAYNVQVRDTLPSTVRDTLPTNFVYTNGGAPPAVDPTVDTTAYATTGVITWSWPDSQPLAGGGSTLTITYDVKIDSDVGPNVSIVNSADVPQSYSLPSGDPNASERKSYSSPPAASTTISSSAPTDLDKSGPISAAVGEEFLYTFRVPGTATGVTLYDVVLTDDLPANLVLIAVEQATGSGGVGFDSSATNIATRHVEAHYSSIPAGQQALVTVRVRLANAPANTNGTVVTNTGRFIYRDAPGGTVQPAITDQHAVTVTEPNLVTAKSGPGTLDLGVSGSYTLTVTNLGSSAAFQTQLLDTLPVGMRQTTPTITAISVGPRNLSDTSPDDFDSSYDGGTGLLTIQLKSVAARIGAGESLLVSYQARLDASGASGPLTNRAVVTRYFSADTSAGGNADIRATNNDPSGGTPQSGDDFRADHTTQGRSPVLTARKQVSATTSAAGAQLTYTVTLRNSGAIDATGAVFTDPLAAEFVPDTIVDLSSTSGTASANGTGGANGTGLITVSGITIPVDGSVTISWKATLKPVLPSGTRVLNQGTLTLPSSGTTLVTDSTNGADDNNIEEGNDGANPNDDDPTVTTIQSAPRLEALKTAVDQNGGILLPGDTILYTITVTNDGTEHAKNVVLQDAIPSSTTYVAGSTTLGGSAVADISGMSPLVSGMSLNGPGRPTGVVNVGDSVVITFRVTVAANVAAGTQIANQAFLNGEGEGSGPIPTEPSDDPNTAADDDPTVLVVGARSLIDALKTAIDVNGGTLQPGDTVRYTIEVRNLGSAAATNVVLRDAITNNSTYSANSMLYTAPGGAAGALSDAADGDAGDFGGTTPGAITVTIGSIPPGASALLSFDVTVNGGVAAGTQIVNQGFVSSDGQPTEPTDADGNDQNGDQPTILVVGDRPALRATKQVFDLNGGQLLPGDELLYTIVLRNVGSQSATNVVLTDPVPPPPTTYIAGSTTLDGRPQGDVAGSSVLATGLPIGTLTAGRAVTVQYHVTVPSNVAAGTVIENQARFTADLGISGVSDSDLDDGVENGNDPNDPNDDDPTRIQIGARPGVASVSGNVWLDTDHDRSFDGNEPPQGGWLVELLLNGQLIATTRTLANGSWLIDGLEPGSGYEVRFRHPETNVVWGQPVSNAPGADVSGGTIRGLTLTAGVTVVQQNLPLDPSGVVYDSITRLPVPGAVVTISGPAGFNPALHLLPGQQNQPTGSDGFYRFDLIGAFPAGTYTITVTPPAGYNPIWPSQILPAIYGTLDPSGGSDPFLVQPQVTPPTAGQATTYYLTLTIDPSDPQIVNNHIPVDPLLEGTIRVTKTTPKSQAVRGDLIPYTITVQSVAPATLNGLQVIDQLPPGFKFVEGSVTVEGAILQNVVSDGRQITVTLATLAPNQTATIKLVAVVGGGVAETVYVNQVFVDDPFGNRLSNTARAAVRIVADPTFDCTDLIGKVFDDLDGDGYQDRNEPGLPNVRLATVNGLLATTDHDGRYHITCADVPNERRGSTFLLKLDERTLPVGYRMTSDNPADIRLTRGKFAKLNFGASSSRVVRLDLDGTGFAGNEPNDPLQRTLDAVLTRLAEKRSVLRLAYFPEPTAPGGGERHNRLIEHRLRAIEKYLHQRWTDDEFWHNRTGSRYTLFIEREQVGVDGNDDGVWSPLDGGVFDGGVRLFEFRTVRSRPVAPNQEAQQPDLADPGSLAVNGRISIDGQPQGDGAPQVVDDQRQADLAWANQHLQLQYDPQRAERRLNLTAVPDAAVRGRTVELVGYSNYWQWIKRAEVRVLRADASGDTEPLEVIALDDVGRGQWQPSATLPDRVRLVLRVYDVQKNFDETAPRTLTLTNAEHPLPDRDQLDRELVTGYGESTLATTNIPVRGGTITVRGKNVPGAVKVEVLGLPTPLDPSGSFAQEQIVPLGTQRVDVEVTDASGRTVTSTRNLYTPNDDWFLVLLADLTISKSNVSGAVEPVTQDERLASEERLEDGRLAFYLKGKIKGKYLLTASLDTREQELSKLFSSLDARDPRQLLRRLDPDRYYPVYGDDSTTFEDAPTQGRLYLKLERGESHFLWGNFQTRLNEVELAQIDRGLYGAHLRLVSSDSTPHGAKRAYADIFAAEPDTVQAQDEFRGTGGSVYHLSHRDLTIGAERVRVETRDKDSDILLAVSYLTPNQDYDIDYIGGRIILTRPLPSTSGDGGPVNDGTLPGNPLYLVVRYEYQPLFDPTDDLAFGGRIAGWVTDNLQFGVTGHRDRIGRERQDLGAFDLTWRRSEETYLRTEVAQSDGPGLLGNSSFDGGFFFDGNQQPVGSVGTRANAFRIESAFRFADIWGGDSKARGHLYWQERQRGFAAPSQMTLRETTQRGLTIDAPLTERTTLKLSYDERDERLGLLARAAELNLGIKLSERWRTDVGLRADEWDSDFTGTTTSSVSPYSVSRRDGRRIDAAVRLGFKRPDADWSLYGILQGTINRTGDRTQNNRGGLGGQVQISERWGLSGEVTGGSGGAGGFVKSDYRVNDRSQIYLGYTLDTDRSDDGFRSRGGSLITGMRNRFNTTSSLFAESRWLHGQRSGLAHAFGLDLAPWDKWQFGITVEKGTLRDQLRNELERKGASLSAGYTGETFAWSSALEARKDDGSFSQRTTWLGRTNATLRLNTDWQSLVKVNLSRSDSKQGGQFDGDFTEIVFGFAYRPIKNDRFNALAKYTFFYDLPAANQRGRDELRLDFQQRSRIAAVDVSYDLANWFTLGAKLGYRSGELRPNRLRIGDWLESKARLAIVRADLRVVHRWDAVVEARILDLDLADDTRKGWLGGLYRQMGKNFKVGLGYNFTDFNDDLTDLSYDDKGWFVNLIGKY